MSLSLLEYIFVTLAGLNCFKEFIWGKSCIKLKKKPEEMPVMIPMMTIKKIMKSVFLRCNIIPNYPDIIPMNLLTTWLNSSSVNGL